MTLDPNRPDGPTRSQALRGSDRRITIRLDQTYDADVAQALDAVAREHPGSDDVVIVIGKRRLTLGVKVNTTHALERALIDTARRFKIAGA